MSSVIDETSSKLDVGSAAATAPDVDGSKRLIAAAASITNNTTSAASHLNTDLTGVNQSGSAKDDALLDCHTKSTECLAGEGSTEKKVEGAGVASDKVAVPSPTEKSRSSHQRASSDHRHNHHTSKHKHHTSASSESCMKLVNMESKHAEGQKSGTAKDGYHSRTSHKSHTSKQAEPSKSGGHTGQPSKNSHSSVASSQSHSKGNYSAKDDRKRKISDSPSSGDSSSKEPSGLQAKRAKMLSLVEERRKQSQQQPGTSSESANQLERGGEEASKPEDGNKFPKSAPDDLHLSSKLVYEPCGLVCTSKYVKDVESEEYSACSFSLNMRQIRFRVAKTTPTKNGQFVTLWKRIGKGPIMPYDIKDPIDLFVVCVRSGDRFGQFVFPKSALANEDIVSRGGKGGKRAIRVYAPWVKPESAQATKTQCWQAKYFLNISDKTKNSVDLARAKRLYAG